MNSASRCDAHAQPNSGTRDSRARPPELTAEGKGRSACRAPVRRAKAGLPFFRPPVAFDDNYHLFLSSRLDDYLPNPELESIFLAAAGRSLTLPEKNLPDPEHLAWHRRTFHF